MSGQDFKNHGARNGHLPTVGKVIAEITDHESDAIGHWGKWGGQFVPKVLATVIGEVTDSYAKARVDQDSLGELDRLQHTYVGRPSPLCHAEKSSADIGADAWLKREDLNHTGSHKANNILGQALLAERMGKKNIIAKTGTGQHSVAAATACALFGLNYRIYMSKVGVTHQRLNIARMRLLGAEAIEVEIDSKTLKDAIDEAMRFRVSHVDDTYYCFGTTTDPHPFPTMVHDFQHIVSAEARQRTLAETGLPPDAVVACVGGGSNAIGTFHHFTDDKSVRLVDTEAGSGGVETGRHAALISAAGNPDVSQGSFTALMQNEDSQITEPHSTSVGLDYPGVGPEYSYLADIDRAPYLSVTDTQAMRVFQDLTWMEGILSAIESAHVVAAVRFISGDPNEELGRKPLITVNVSSHGDKDIDTAAKWFDLMEES